MNESNLREIRNRLRTLIPYGGNVKRSDAYECALDRSEDERAVIAAYLDEHPDKPRLDKSIAIELTVRERQELVLAIWNTIDKINSFAGQLGWPQWNCDDRIETLKAVYGKIVCNGIQNKGETE